MADEDGSLDASDISDATGFPVKSILLALEVLSDKRIGWIIDDSKQTQTNVNVYEQPTVQYITLQKNTEEKNNTCEVPPAEDTYAGSGISFILKSGEEYRLTAEDLSRLTKTFPHVDINQELAEAAIWCQANPAKRKTASGMLRFLSGWLKRSAPENVPIVKESKSDITLAFEALELAGWQSLVDKHNLFGVSTEVELVNRLRVDPKLCRAIANGH